MVIFGDKKPRPSKVLTGGLSDWRLKAFGFPATVIHISWWLIYQLPYKKIVSNFNIIIPYQDLHSVHAHLDDSDHSESCDAKAILPQKSEFLD